jgi:curved DNA-binding protein CbpA
MIGWRSIHAGYKDRLEAMRQQDPYELLGVNRNANKQELRAAYLNIIKRYHPDSNTDFLKPYATEYVKIINLAYQKLTRELRRDR